MCTPGSLAELICPSVETIILTAILGDFSFAHSLAENHGCKRMLATCFDSEDTLYEKYPQSKKIVSQLCGPTDSTDRGLKRKREGTSDHGKETSSDDESTDDTVDPEPTTQSPSPQVLFSIDAKKLGLTGGGGKLIRKGFPRIRHNANGNEHHKPTQSQPKEDSQPTAQSSEIGETGPWDKICFNFPHVGGLSTDVNRQVRANQELIVSFFKACIPLLSAPPIKKEEDEWLASLNDDMNDEEVEDTLDSKNEGSETFWKTKSLRKEPGQIVVTLFEGEPYTLWNIRDLARHSGLRVVTSFKFPWSSYPGYSHARTLGEIEGKDGERGGWRGEDREARSYVFERKVYEKLGITPGKKRKAKNLSDDSDDN